MHRRNVLTSTANIFSQINPSAKSFLGSLLVLSLSNIAITGVSPNSTPHQTKLDSIYFYDPTRTAIYQLLVDSESLANNLIRQIREGLCGADARGSFPIVNFEKIGEWGWNNFATLLGAVNREVKQAFEACLIENISQRADKQDEDVGNIFKFLGVILLAAVIIGACCLIGCCLYDSHITFNNFKNSDSMQRKRQERREDKKLIAEMEAGQVASYGSFRPA